MANKQTGTMPPIGAFVRSCNRTKQPVWELQGYLRVISTKHPTIPMLKQDGIFGALTTEAVQEFQAIYQLQVTGIVDFETWDKIYAVYLPIRHKTNPPSEKQAFPIPNETLKRNDTGTFVEMVQTMLNEIGRKMLPITPIAHIGKYDDITAENVAMLQLVSGLPQTGETDATTWNAMIGIYRLAVEQVPPTK